MKILLFGANGQLGHELSRTLPALGEVKACGRAKLDMTNGHSIAETIDTFKPDVIVNAAAYTDVDKAESERDLAFKVNAEAVGIIADEATKRDIWLVHYSTDYVFDGSKTEPHLETDVPNPISVYGESKLAGEQAITGSGCKHLIFRTTWVIGKDGSNFAKTILRLGSERDTLSIINEQFGVPTAPALIAKVTNAVIEAIVTARHWPSGIYYLAPPGKTTWYGIALMLLQLAKEACLPLATDESALQAITTAEYTTSAKRPANSLLDTSKLEKQLKFKLPDWKEDFAVVANEIIERQNIDRSADYADERRLNNTQYNRRVLNQRNLRTIKANPQITQIKCWIRKITEDPMFYQTLQPNFRAKSLQYKRCAFNLRESASSADNPQVSAS